MQSLRSVPATPQGRWDEDQDVVRGEQRGSFLIERYIDPHDPELNTTTHPQYDFAAQADAAAPPTLTRFYKLRVIANRQFRP